MEREQELTKRGRERERERGRDADMVWSVRRRKYERKRYSRRDKSAFN